MADAIGPKTRIVLTSSPNNPTGVVYGREVIAEMGRVIRRREAELGTEIFLISDEPYRKILFDGLEYPHIFEHHVRSVVATSHSKDLAFPASASGSSPCTRNTPTRKS